MFVDRNAEFGKRLRGAVRVPIIALFLMWGTKIFEFFSGDSLSNMGIWPRRIESIGGILLSPFIHGDFAHLLSNSAPVLVLGIMIFYFYPRIGSKILLSITIVTGFWVWALARPAYHIGASGIVYGLASFLFFAGALSRNNKLMALSLIVTFLYGGLFWGIFPTTPGVSWESHLMGAFSGLLFAIYYRKQLPPPKRYSWEDDDDLPDDGPWNKEYPYSRE
ncbi:MAG: membrane associated rhomboid family serine protease [Sphingobacteriales bacterium]|jgi:membrane associated rhomboid family serine protease